MFRFFCFVLFLLFHLPFQSTGQKNPRIDTLEQGLVTASKEEKAHILSELVWAYRDCNPEKGLQYSEEGLTLLRELNDKKGEAELLLYIGVCHYQLDHPELAIHFYLESLKLKESFNDLKGVAALLNNVGVIYKDMGDNKKALESYEKALEIGKKLGNKKLEATTLANIAVMYRSMNQLDKSLTYNLEALGIREEIQDLKGTSVSLNNIAIIYADSSYSGVNLKKASDYLNRSLKIKEKTGDVFGLSQGLINMGQMNVELKEFGKAIVCFNRAVQIAQEIKAKSVEATCYKHIAHYYEQLGRYREALGYEVKYADLKDSVNNITYSQKIAEMQVKYETEKKEKENELLKKESSIQALQINKQRNLRNFFVILALLIFGFAIALYSRFVLKKRTNRLLEVKNEELAMLNATKDKFFRIIAHDLKNPFSTLLSLSKQLEERFGELNEEQKLKSIQLINHSAKLTHNLLENLLKWSMLQSGTVSFNPERIDLKELLLSGIDLIQPTAQKKHITIQANMQENLFAFIDRNMITTVIMNLLSNAVKFSEQPGTINLTAQKIGNNLIEVRIQDEGIGLSAKDKESLFRIDINHAMIGHSKEKGTGLGLILCKEFVEKNGGVISAQSELNAGSTFSFTVPAFSTL